MPSALDFGERLRTLERFAEEAEVSSKPAIKTYRSSNYTLPELTFAAWTPGTSPIAYTGSYVDTQSLYTPGSASLTAAVKGIYLVHFDCSIVTLNQTFSTAIRILAFTGGVHTVIAGQSGQTTNVASDNHELTLATLYKLNAGDVVYAEAATTFSSEPGGTRVPYLAGAPATPESLGTHMSLIFMGSQ
jgi:hypothetical protein